MNFTDLQREVPRILMAQNSELTDCATMRGIVERATERVVNLLDHDAFAVTSIPDQTVKADGVLDLSAPVLRVLEPRAVYFGRRPLLMRSEDSLLALYPVATPGDPVYYAQTAPRVYRVFPAPGLPVTLSVRANVKPVPASPDQPDNVLTRDYARLHTAAVLLETALFMKSREDEERWAAELGAAAGELNPAVARRRRDETGQRPRRTENVQGE